MLPMMHVIATKGDCIVCAGTGRARRAAFHCVNLECSSVNRGGWYKPDCNVQPSPTAMEHGRGSAQGCTPERVQSPSCGKRMWARRRGINVQWRANGDPIDYYYDYYQYYYDSRVAWQRVATTSQRVASDPTGARLLASEDFRPI